MTQEKVSLRRNYVFNLSNKIISLVIPLLVTPYITRIFSSDDLGVYTYTNTIASYFVTFTLMGIGMYGSKQISLSKHDSSFLEREYSSLLTVQSLNSLLALVIYGVYLLLFPSSHQAIYWIQMLYVISAGFDVSWYLSGVEQFKDLAIRNVAVNVLSAILIFSCVHGPEDLWVYTVIKAGTVLLSQLALFIPLVMRTQFRRPHLGDLVKAYKGLFLLFIPVLADTLFQTMDKVMLGIYATYASVGLYYASRMITDIPQTVITSLNTILFPRLTALVSQDKLTQARSLFYRSFILIIALSLATAFGVSAIAQDFVSLFFGRSYAAVASYVPVLALYICLAAWSGTIRYQYLIPHSMEKTYVSAIVLGSVLNLVFNWLLIPHFDVYGAIVATLISELVICLYETYPIRKDIALGKLLIFVLGFSIAALIMWAGIILVRGALVAYLERFSLLFVEIVSGLLIFVSLSSLVVYLLDKELWKNIKKLIRK